ncbi:MAG TPA: MFS transporter [Acidimicrobiales bacterium]|nr:MFS transporter [Acidimicrobiales bacterium]
MNNYELGAPADPRRWWSLVVLCLSLFIVVLGNTVLNIAIPTLVEELSASDRDLQWIVDAYALVFAGLLFTGGSLGDRFGRKGALYAGLLVFASGSAYAGFGDSSLDVIVGRAIMGVGAALVMPATLSILTNVFPPAERARAIAIWAGIAGAAGAVGPIVGGYLLEHFWWGSIFFVNLVFVTITMVAGATLVPTSRDPAEAPLDVLGAALSIGAIATLVYGIIEAPQRGWLDDATLLSFAAAVVFGSAFAWWELRSRAPMLDLRYFRRPGFSGGSIAISMMFFGLFGMFFILTQYMQLVRGYGPLETGVRTLPFALTLMVAAPSSARLAERFGSKAVVSTGMVVTALGMLLTAQADVRTSYAMLVVMLVVLAAGMGLTMAPSTTSIMSSLPLGKAGVGSAMNDTNRELGGALGVAVLGSVLATQYSSGVSTVLQGAPAEVAAAARSSLGGAVGVARLTGNEPLVAAARESFTDAMGTALTIAAVVILVAVVFVARLVPHRLGTSEDQPRYGAVEGAETDSTRSVS